MAKFDAEPSAAGPNVLVAKSTTDVGKKTARDKSVDMCLVSMDIWLPWL